MTRASGIPPPLSLTIKIISSFSWRTFNVTVPASALPSFLRSLGVSIPCATAFRNKCSKGAPILSNTLLSSSISSPSIKNSTCLLSSRAVCRTIRCKRSVNNENGNIRTLINACCNSRFIRFCCCNADSV